MRKFPEKGISRLRKAGCEVLSGVLEHESRELNKRFFTYHEKKRPYIILKWAQSADRFLDVIRQPDYQIGPNWITGKSEKVLVHKWRSAEQAILVGAETVRADNPSLNVREWTGTNPVKLILSNSGLLNGKLSLNSAESKVIVFTNNKTISYPGAQKILLKEDIPASRQITDYLYHEGIQSLFIEGGAKVLTHFISNGLWDEARIFTGQSNFKSGVSAPTVSGTLISETIFNKSLLCIYSQ